MSVDNDFKDLTPDEILKLSADISDAQWKAFLESLKGRGTRPAKRAQFLEAIEECGCNAFLTLQFNNKRIPWPAIERITEQVLYELNGMAFGSALPTLPLHKKIRGYGFIEGLRSKRNGDTKDENPHIHLMLYLDESITNKWSPEQLNEIANKALRKKCSSGTAVLGLVTPRIASIYSTKMWHTDYSKLKPPFIFFNEYFAYGRFDKIFA